MLQVYFYFLRQLVLLGTLYFSWRVGLDKLIGESHVGITVKDKLRKVAGWLQRANLAHCGSILNYNEVSSEPPYSISFTKFRLDKDV